MKCDPMCAYERDRYYGRCFLRVADACCNPMHEYGVNPNYSFTFCQNPKLSLIIILARDTVKRLMKLVIEIYREVPLSQFITMLAIWQHNTIQLHSLLQTRI